MSYDSGDSVSINEIAGVEFDSEPDEEMNNDNAEPVHYTTDISSKTPPEAAAYDLRYIITTNVSGYRVQK